jgi:hypothetical protein
MKRNHKYQLMGRLLVVTTVSLFGLCYIQAYAQPSLADVHMRSAAIKHSYFLIYADSGVRRVREVHPRQFTFQASDSGVRFSQLRWADWGASEATASGRAQTCGSGGIEGFVCHTGHVTLEALDMQDGRYIHVRAFGVPDYGSVFDVTEDG